MAVTFRCSCRQQIEAIPGVRGQQGLCPRCLQVVTVPGANERVAVLDAKAADPPRMRVCPGCGRDIRAVARKCRFCGEILDPSLLQARQVFGARGPSPAEVTPTKTSWMAGLGLALAFLGLVAYGATSLPAIVLGHLAVRELQREPDLEGAGQATAALVLGYLGAGIWLLVLVARHAS